MFGYWGTLNNQIAETAAHVNFVHAIVWGDRDSVADRARMADVLIAQIQEAEARGVHKVILTVDSMIFTNAYVYRGTAELLAFKARVDALGLAGNIVALYPVDEPELYHSTNDAALTAILGELRAAWPGPKMAVVYGDMATKPALASYDWIGYDNYGIGAGAMDRLPPISGDQRWLLVPGGTNPWANPPEPWYARANSDTRVIGIMPFVWFDGFENDFNHRGIRSNGLAGAYCRVGMRIKQLPETACPPA
jgi:hypothetical protein